MNRKAFLAAIAFLLALALFSLSAPSPFSLPTVSPAYAQSAEPEFPSGEITRSVDENTDPYEEIGAPVTATGDGITYSLKTREPPTSASTTSPDSSSSALPWTTKPRTTTPSRSSPPIHPTAPPRKM